MKRTLSAIYCISFFLLFASCSRWAAPYRMFAIDENTELSSNDLLTNVNEHVLQCGDEFYLYVIPNMAAKNISPDVVESTDQVALPYTYRIMDNGSVFLPSLGEIRMAGMTIPQAEEYLRISYSILINEPYVRIQLANKRVMVFVSGRSANATTLICENPNITLIEALASAGGISEGKAYEILIIRNTNGNRQLFLVDLSKAANVNLCNVVLQSDDVIYVNSKPYVSRRVIEDISPYLSVASTFLLIYNLFK